MQNFRKLAQVAVAAAALLASVPAFAQFYPLPLPFGGYQQQPDYYRPPPPPPPPPPPYYDNQPSYDYRRGYERPRYRQQRAYGAICYTKRGSCDLNQSLPVGSYCRCYIQGFGSKQGEVVQ